MIYSINCINDNIVESFTYNDRNEFEWEITRCDKGLYIKYMGDSYFKESTFECYIEILDKYIRIKNNDYLYIEDYSNEMFIDIWRAIIMLSTDEIWEFFENMFVNRLETNVEILDIEHV